MAGSLIADVDGDTCSALCAILTRCSRTCSSGPTAACVAEASRRAKLDDEPDAVAGVGDRDALEQDRRVGSAAGRELIDDKLEASAGGA